MRAAFTTKRGLAVEGQLEYLDYRRDFIPSARLVFQGRRRRITPFVALGIGAVTACGSFSGEGVTQLTRATACASPGAQRAALYNSRPTMNLTKALDETVAAARAAGALLLADFHRPGGARGKIDKADADVEA
jgi:hypothetical protein